MIHFPNYFKWPLRPAKQPPTASRRSKNYYELIFEILNLKNLYFDIHHDTLSLYFKWPLRSAQQPPRPYIWPLTEFLSFKSWF